jgi:L-malate glycosyltransferase
MRVCLCTSYFPPTIGGAERQTAHLASGLVRLGDDVTVVTRHLPGHPIREVREGVQIHRVIRPGNRGVLFGLGYVLSLSAFFLRPAARFDVVQAIGVHLNAYVVCRLGRFRDYRTVVRPMALGPDGDLDVLARMPFWPLWRRGDPLTRRHILRRIQGADAIVAVNRELIGDLVASGFPSQRIVHIANGVPVPPSPCDRIAAMRIRHSLGIHDDPLLLFVGRLDQHKGAGRILPALSALRDRYPRIGLVLLGDGPLRDDLKTEAVRCGVQARVHFLGVQDPAAFLQAADVFVLPTRGEGMSSALLEAMAAGLPCVTTRVTGNIEVVTHNETGLLVEPGSPEALRETIARVLSDPALCSRLGQAARRHVQRTHSAERMVTEYRSLYARLTAGETLQTDGSEGSGVP